MIWTHVLKKGKIQSKDVDSIGEIKDLEKETNWIWLDCLDPLDQELEIISNLLGEEELIGRIKNKEVFHHHQKLKTHVLIPAILVNLKEKLQTYPLYIFVNTKLFITIRDKNSAISIKNTLRTLQDCFKKVKCKTSSSFVVSRLFHEVTNQNLDMTVELQSRIAEIEERSLKKPADHEGDKEIFRLKREISKLERVFWSQREVMLNLEEGVVPISQPSTIDRETLNHNINNVSRELSLIDDYNEALDNILSVRSLGMIHKVESKLVYLTIIIVVLTLIMILLELGIFRFLFG